MTKLNITSKMSLWALFPIICFTIAIAATKWYCDAAKEDIPSELTQNNTPLNWQNVSFENLPAELKTQINPKRNLFYRVADASYSFPNLKNKIAENNPNFKIYSYLVYKKNGIFQKLESQWIYYNNNGMWVLENTPLYPDFEDTTIDIIWILSLVICLIVLIFGLYEGISNQVDGINTFIIIPTIITGIPSLGSILWDVSIASGFSVENYPIWILVALILCEIAVLALVYGIYSSKLDKIDDKKNQENKLNAQIEEHKPSKLNKNIFGRYYQNDTPDKNNRLEIVINEEFIFIKENNKWDKYTYEFSNIEEEKSILFINRNSEYISVVAHYYKYWPKHSHLYFNNLHFSRKTDEEIERSRIEWSLKKEIVEELHKPNIKKRIFTKSSCLEKKEQIEKLYDECFDSIYDSEIEKGFEKYNDPIYGQEYSESNIPQEVKDEIKKKIINYIKNRIAYNS